MGQDQIWAPNNNSGHVGAPVTGTNMAGNKHALDVNILGDAPAIANTTPIIFNVTVGTANTEFSQALPANTKKFIIKSRNSAKITFYYSPSATETLTINAGFSFEDTSFYLGQTIYFKCSKADVIEVVAYV